MASSWRRGGQLTRYMRFRELSASTRFFVSLVVLLAALGGMAGLGLRGLADVNRMNGQVFNDNFRSAEATSALASSLARAQVMTLDPRADLS